MSNSPNKWGELRRALLLVWGQRSPREQRMLGLAAGVLVLAGLWGVALAPALRTWQEAPLRQAQLDAQTQRMRQLQAQAKGLQKPSPTHRAEAIQWLQSNLGELGAGAKIQLQGERVSLSVEAAPAEQMARWLGQARERAQALPLQAQLQQTPAPTKSAGAPAASASPSPKVSGSPEGGAVFWRGTLVLRLPEAP